MFKTLLLAATALVAQVGLATMDNDGMEASQIAYPPELVQWVQDAGMIFRGRVKKLRASTLPVGKEPLDNYVVVDAEQVITPKVFAGYKGQITFRLTKKPDFGVGYEGYFFGNTGMMGNTILLREVAHLAAAPYPALPSHVRKISEYLSDLRFYRRIASSALVVTGEVQNDDRSLGLGPVSEHNPEWHQVTVKISKTIHGIPYATVPVRYSASRDQMHYQKPKLKSGQNALFLLREDTLTKAPGKAFLVIDPSDVQNEGNLPRVEKLLKNPPQPPVAR